MLRSALRTTLPSPRPTLALRFISKEMGPVEPTKLTPDMQPSIPQSNQHEARTLQAPNRTATWSSSQIERSQAMKGPRFEQTDFALQPTPYAAVELIKEEPVRFSDKRVARCDGGGGPRGHPAIYINLDRSGPQACSYCGVRYEMKHHDDHTHSLNFIQGQ